MELVQRSFDFGYTGGRGTHEKSARVARLERRMVDALARQEGLVYASAVEALGIEPVDPNLYERGKLDASLRSGHRVRDSSFFQRYLTSPLLTDKNRGRLGQYFERGFIHALD